MSSLHEGLRELIGAGCALEAAADAAELVDNILDLHAVDDGTKPDVLREEGLPEADALVTLTESDETNLIISSFAYHEQVPKIVTKVDEDNFIELAESYGLTTMIQPADVTAGRIVEYVRWMQNSARSSGVETLRMVADGQAEALEFIVRAESQFLDVPLKALKLKDSVLFDLIDSLRRRLVRNSHPDDLTSGGLQFLDLCHGSIHIVGLCIAHGLNGHRGSAAHGYLSHE